MPAAFVLVDTDVFIWLTRGRAEARRYEPYVSEKRIALSFVSVAELWRGAYALGYGERSRKKLMADIAACTVVPVTDALTHEWARLVVEARAMGHALGQSAQAHDAWIAATGRLYSLQLLTGNEAHFSGLPNLELVALDDPAGT